MNKTLNLFAISFLIISSSCEKNDLEKNEKSNENFRKPIQVTFDLKDSAEVKRMFKKDPKNFYTNWRSLPFKSITELTNITNKASNTKETNSYFGGTYNEVDYDESTTEQAEYSDYSYEYNMGTEEDGDRFLPYGIYGDLWIPNSGLSTPQYRVGSIDARHTFQRRPLEIKIYIPYRYAVQGVINGPYNYKFTYAGRPEVTDGYPQMLMTVYPINDYNGMGDLKSDQMQGSASVTRDGSISFTAAGLREERVKVIDQSFGSKIINGLSLSSLSAGTELSSGTKVQSSQYIYNFYSAQGEGSFEQTSNFPRPFYTLLWSGFSDGPQI